MLIAALVLFALRLLRDGGVLRPAEHGRRPLPSRASAAAAWCPRRCRWWPTCTPSSGAACRSASSARCRSSAACSGRCSAPWCCRSRLARSSLHQPGRGPGAGRRRAPPASAVVGAAEPTSPLPGAGSGRRDWSPALPRRCSPRDRRDGVHPAAAICTDLTWGQLFIPVDGDNRWVTPLGVADRRAGRAAAVVLVQLRAHPLVDLRRSGCTVRGGRPARGLLACSPCRCSSASCCSRPRTPGAVFSTAGPWFLAAPPWPWSCLLLLHLRRPVPLDRPAQRAAPYPRLGLAGGQLLRRLGADRRARRHPVVRGPPSTRLPAGRRLVLVRFLSPCRSARCSAAGCCTVNAGVVTAVGMAAAGVAFLAMAQWDKTSLDSFAITSRSCSAAWASGSPWRPSTPRVLASPTTTRHGLASASWSWPGWSACSSGSPPHHHRPAPALRRRQAEDPAWTCAARHRPGARGVRRRRRRGFAAGLLALVLFARRTRGVDTAEVLRAGGRPSHGRFLTTC